MEATTTYTEQQLDDWGNIFGACAGTWPWWVAIDHLDGGDWKTPSRVRLAIEDPYDASLPDEQTFSPANIFAALDKATELYPWHFDRRDGLLDLDAGSADVVLQVAMYGEIIYG